MATLTIEMDNVLVHEIEDSARREKKTPGAWAVERLKAAAMEAAASQKGYPPGWLKLFASIPEGDGFEAPPRAECRKIEHDAD